MMFRLLALCPLILSLSNAFAPIHQLSATTSAKTLTSTSTSTSLKASTDDNSLNPGDAVLLVGPGFLQLNIAKAAKAAGLRPIIVAPQQKIDSFAQYVNDAEIIRDATIGMADPGEPFYGEISGVVFCAEEAILPASIVSTILDWKDREVFSPGGIKRTIACLPVSGKVNKEKGMGWMPVFNNDGKEKKVWAEFSKAYNSHPCMKNDGQGSLVRFGSLLGGSVDGADELQAVGLDECVYKMSLENYRDLKERSFDRYRLGAQVIEGDTINAEPPNQKKMEKDAIKNGEYLEAFRAVGGYPEIDRSNRHTVAQGVVQTLMRSTADVPKEFTILSKCVSSLPTEEEWNEVFENPSAASWPDPYAFDPSQYGFEVETA